MRKRRGARERERLLLLYERTCHICGMPIKNGEPFDIDHLVEWTLTRDDSDENLRPAHKRCHAEKSAARITDIRKADRQRMKHNKSWPPSPRPMRSRNTFQKRREMRDVST